MVSFQKERYTVEDLLCIMQLLRSSCPWDREQTHKSIRKNFIEETYEAVEAIDSEDFGLLKEELGDVLLQVAFHAQIAKESGNFDFGDVCDAVCKKLIVRHPHVFASTKAESAEQALQGWEQVKNKGKPEQTVTQSLKNIPLCLPALMRSQKVQQKAAKAGFDYPDLDFAMTDLRSEVEEVQGALGSGDSAQLEEELGDLIFSAVNISRFAGVEAEEALTRSCDKFIARFARVEQLACEKNINMQTASIQMLDSLWKEAKKQKS